MTNDIIRKGIIGGVMGIILNKIRIIGKNLGNSQKNNG